MTARVATWFAALIVSAGVLTGCGNDNSTAGEQNLPEAMVMGNLDAPVEIIEYASMTCSFCASFHSGTLPRIKRDYIDSGDVKLVFREFPLDSRAAAASLLARCAAEDGGQKRFFGFIQVLFDQQRNWALAEDGYAAMQEIARQGGFSAEKFAACMNNRVLLEKLYAQAQHADDEFSIRSTPTFFVNGERLEGALGYERFRDTINRHLGR